ncbi:hypothetical protein [Pseudomonas aeruginosa]|uniref:hypothetical protein n=1 Tax=Pseudomonas aeruginosa TaxID=287 RepID=UPI002741D45D|nr:hypothetical protein [Pseudomonas aeruginosa]WLS76482.1 hypothetical protein RAH33_15455 [Pseudomonas aeruginosa]
MEAQNVWAVINIWTNEVLEETTHYQAAAAIEKTSTPNAGTQNMSAHSSIPSGAGIGRNASACPFRSAVSMP